MSHQSPSPRRAGKAGLIIAIALAVTFLGFFGLRVFWHADVQESDPASLNAPDMTNDAEVPAPAEQ